MEIKRYLQGGVRIIEVYGEQGKVIISSPPDGQTPEVTWFRKGSWKQEQALLDLKENDSHEDAEPFRDLLLKALEIARQWRYNSTYYYKFSEKESGKGMEMCHFGVFTG